MSLVRGLITLTLLVLFVRLTIWAWSARRKPMFDSLARLPLDEDGDDDESAPRSKP
jgi:cytochrome c oxidase cbb3-type subunit 4